MSMARSRRLKTARGARFVRVVVLVFLLLPTLVEACGSGPEEPKAVPLAVPQCTLSQQQSGVGKVVNELVIDGTGVTQQKTVRAYPVDSVLEVVGQTATTKHLEIAPYSAGCALSSAVQPPTVSASYLLLQPGPATINNFVSFAVGGGEVAATLLPITIVS